MNAGRDPGLRKCGKSLLWSIHSAHCPSPIQKPLKINFQTWLLEIQLNLPGTAEADSQLSMLHFHGEQMGRRQVKFTQWKWLKEDLGTGVGLLSSQGSSSRERSQGSCLLFSRGLLTPQAGPASPAGEPAKEG